MSAVCRSLWILHGILYSPSRWTHAPAQSVWAGFNFTIIAFPMCYFSLVLRQRSCSVNSLSTSLYSNADAMFLMFIVTFKITLICSYLGFSKVLGQTWRWLCCRVKKRVAAVRLGWISSQYLQPCADMLATTLATSHSNLIYIIKNIIKRLRLSEGASARSCGSSTIFLWKSVMWPHVVLCLQSLYDNEY